MTCARCRSTAPTRWYLWRYLCELCGLQVRRINNPTEQDEHP